MSKESKFITTYAEDMEEQMSRKTKEIAVEAFNVNITKGKVYSTIALHIRQALDKTFGPGWNVVVGRNFGALVTHKIKTYIYFTVVKDVYVLCWRS